MPQIQALVNGSAYSVYRHELSAIKAQAAIQHMLKPESFL